MLNNIMTRISSREYTVGIIGLGYVGIPLALTACMAGFKVIGFDINPVRVQQVNDGQSFKHISADAMMQATQEGRFGATSDFDRLQDVDAILIAVPTPLS